MVASNVVQATANVKEPTEVARENTATEGMQIHCMQTKMLVRAKLVSGST